MTLKLLKTITKLEWNRSKDYRWLTLLNSRQGWVCWKKNKSVWKLWRVWLSLCSVRNQYIIWHCFLITNVPLYPVWTWQMWLCLEYKSTLTHNQPSLCTLSHTLCPVPLSFPVFLLPLSVLSFLSIRYKTVGLGSFKSGLAVSELFEVNCSKESIYPVHHHHLHIFSSL